jgi:hypothetical protein
MNAEVSATRPLRRPSSLMVDNTSMERNSMFDWRDDLCLPEGTQ